MRLNQSCIYSVQMPGNALFMGFFELFIYCIRKSTYVAVLLLSIFVLPVFADTKMGEEKSAGVEIPSRPCPVMADNAKQNSNSPDKTVHIVADAVQCKDGKGEYDFGYVEAKSKHIVTFRVFNNFDTDIRIRRTRSECKCMKVGDPNTVHRIPVGGYADIAVDFEAPDEVEHYSKRIILQTYDKRMRYISLRIKADVDLPLKLENATISAGDLAPGKKITLPSAVIHNRGKQDIRLAYATSSDSKCVAAIPREAVAAGGKLTIPVTITAAETTGEHKATVRIHTPLSGQKIIILTIKYNVAENIDGVTIIKQRQQKAE